MRRLALGALCCAALLAAPAARAADDPAAGLPASLAPLSLAGALERHSPDTLWERIDGEAELYKAYGLAASAHARFEDPADPERRVELSVFAFAEPLGAFGIFAAFRPPECAPVRPLGNGGCLGELQGFFWHGGRFVLADAAGPGATRGGDLRRALEASAALLGPPPARPGALRLFARYADTHTIRYQPLHLLGRAALPPGLEGTAGGMTLFVSTGEPAGTAAALEAYARTLGQAARGEHRGLPVLTGTDPALGPVTLVGGERRIAGARAGGGTGLLEQLADLAAGDEGTAGDGTW